MKAISIALSICFVSVAGIVSYASGQQADKPVTAKAGTTVSTKQALAHQDAYVGVYMTSVARQIKMSDLTKAYPSDRPGVVDKGRLAADSIVGWYDKGNNYHEQKMQNNLKVDWGGKQILPATLRGIALRGAQTANPQ